MPGHGGPMQASLGASQVFDTCVVGHVTKDLVQIGTRQIEMPGGTAFYSSLVLAGLGANVVVVTRIAHGDRYLLDGLIHAGISVCCADSETTTRFENIYSRDLNKRVQLVRELAEPIGTDHLSQISARSFHLGPLTKKDISLELMELASIKGLVLLDLQGFARSIENGRVRGADWEDKERGLACVNILKADETEAAIVTGEADPERAARKLAEYGPDEVVITCGSWGSLINGHGTLFRIPAFPSEEIVDATGCGDTFAAAYLYKRLQGTGIREAGEFASRAAAVKLKVSGPLSTNELLDYLR